MKNRKTLWISPRNPLENYRLKGGRGFLKETPSSKLLSKNFKMTWCSLSLKVQHGVTCGAVFEFLFSRFFFQILFP